MASLTWWTWVWVNSGSWWWTGRPGELRFMGSQSRTWLSDWSDLIWNPQGLCYFNRYVYLEKRNISVSVDTCSKLAPNLGRLRTPWPTDKNIGCEWHVGPHFTLSPWERLNSSSLCSTPCFISSVPKCRWLDTLCRSPALDPCLQE